MLYQYEFDEDVKDLKGILDYKGSIYNKVLFITIYIDDIQQIKIQDVEPISSNWTEIKFVKIFGNKLIVISLNEASKPTLSVFDTQQTDYLIQKELIAKKGK